MTATLRASFAVLFWIGVVPVVGAVPYDRQTGRWLFDAEPVVSGYDVLYVTPENLT